MRMEPQTLDEIVKKFFNTNFNSKDELTLATTAIFKLRAIGKNVGVDDEKIRTFVSMHIDKFIEYGKLAEAAFPVFFTGIQHEDGVTVWKHKIVHHSELFNLRMASWEAYKQRLVANIEEVLVIINNYPIKINPGLKQKVLSLFDSHLKDLACKSATTMDQPVTYEQLAYEYHEQQIQFDINEYKRSFNYTDITKIVMEGLLTNREQLVIKGYPKYLDEHYVRYRQSVDELLVKSVRFLERFGTLTTEITISQQIGELIKQYHQFFKHLESLIAGEAYVTIHANDLGAKS